MLEIWGRKHITIIDSSLHVKFINRPQMAQFAEGKERDTQTEGTVGGFITLNFTNLIDHQTKIGTAPAPRVLLYTCSTMNVASSA